MLSRLIYICCLAFLPLISLSQTCQLTVTGEVIDHSSAQPMAYANIYISELEIGMVTDSTGAFSFTNLCPDSLHLKISHLGCQTQVTFLVLKQDTHLHIELDHHSHLLEEVAITAQYKQETTQNLELIGQAHINENASKNLGTMLQNMTGVSTIKNGNSIAKPVVHGMYGNRLTILNNGIPQSGQQWGADHAPEIDPLSANTITVYKGVSTLEYAGNSLGSVILLAPSPIENEPHIHGKASYFFESNGLGNGAHLQLQKKGNFMGWRANATYKKRGDMHTPTYYLTNTGSEELNGSLQLEKQIGKFQTNVYASSYNTTLGILKGAHVGNLTDLENALNRDKPFYTNDYFSYKINPPYQKVNHHLVKAFGRYQHHDSIFIEGTYAFQLDQRKEFDVRRSSTNTKPGLSIDQKNHYAELKYKQYLKNKWTLKAGYQFIKTNNLNIPETNILPLIPDYIAYENGYFFLLAKQTNQLSFEAGGRIDTEWRSVVTIDNNASRDIIRYQNNYINYGASAGLTWHYKEQLEFGFNTGIAGRNPEVNELYSNGLHQGVGAIEEGDPNLLPEQSLKNSFSVKYATQNKWFIDVVAYHQYIDNFIFLNPSDEIRLTIRGAFPVYHYEQTQASLLGTDVATTYLFNEQWSATLKYSFLQGNNLSQNIPLINMPPNNIYGAIKYEIPEWGKFKNFEIELTQTYTFEQSHYVDGQDYKNPPKGYYLLGANIRTDRHFKTNTLTMYLRGENLLNTVYRDYLNRWRYYANETGINLVLGASFKF